MKKTFKILGYLCLGLIAVATASGVYVKTMLPNVGDAPQLTVDPTPARIARGEYLANHVTVCMDCHSTRATDRYSGPLVHGNFGGGGERFGPEMGFPGVFYSRNITPFGIGDWTDGELFRAITTGVTKEGEALFPVMPYHNYGQMDPEDIYSIIAYVRTLKPVENTLPSREPDFPVSVILNTMPTKANPGKRPSDDDILARGKYITSAAACVECHSKVDKGSKIAGTEYGGGMEFSMPAGVVRSPNITGDKATGIGNWSEQEFIKRFKMYVDSSYVPHPVGPKDMNTPMPWTMYGHMEEQDLKAIFAYLQSLEPISHKVERFTPAL
ncbi:MAG TPA: c-type cytochrome [Dyadobacter sp.]|jgi:mono/diheme cytochrome c family protein|nr:c-type cytochrome [Dyadobacter sp.]